MTLISSHLKVNAIVTRVNRFKSVYDSQSIPGPQLDSSKIHLGIYVPKELGVFEQLFEMFLSNRLSHVGIFPSQQEEGQTTYRYFRKKMYECQLET